MGDTDFDTRLKTYLAAKAAVEQKTKDEAAASAASERSQTAGFRVKLFQLITWLTIISFTYEDQIRLLKEQNDILRAERGTTSGQETIQTTNP
jgi:hypothetical protein